MTTTMITDETPACALDPDLWFAENPHLMRRAAAICRTCPLLDACTRYIAAHPDPHGVWAGQLPSQRPHAKPAHPEARCGTTAGHQRHRRNHERSCDACQEANREYRRQWDAARRKAS